MLHFVSAFESCSRYHINSVGVLFWVSSHSSEGSVSSPACFNAKIARDVSLIVFQWFDFLLDFSASTQSSKILSGVARTVSAISSVDNDLQSFAFSSKHSKPSSILSGSCCAVVVSDVSSVSSSAHLSSSHVSSVAQSLSDVQSSPTSAKAIVIENSNRNKIANTPSFFMYR